LKLIRFGPKNDERPGLLDPKGVRRDCSAFIPDYSAEHLATESFIGLRSIAESRLDTLPIVSEDARWAAPVARPGKVICIGLNYSDHAKESNMPVPDQPVVFFKAPNTVVGPYDEVLIPRGSEKTDWEVELGVVIGAEARYLDSQADAAACIAGYCISNDVSERAFQLEHGGQWVKGKSCDTFNPLGPYLVTPDELADAQALDMTLDVNGQPMQRGNTRTMVFSVTKIIHYLSQYMTLEPGDLISTGTPPGVGLGMKPPRFLKAGDVIELTIDGLGKQRQVCGAA
jgi:2,4-didehydro-3-deoxy-L-rhamnonate hydrolase